MLIANASKKLMKIFKNTWVCMILPRALLYDFRRPMLKVSLFGWFTLKPSICW